MSFGFSVGDFVAVGQLAWNVYKSCKNAPTSFNNLSSEVLALHAVLREADEILSGNKLPDTSRGRLDVIMTGSRGVLNDLQVLLDKYQGLGSKTRRTFDRLNWQSEDIAGLRLRLISHTGLLSAFMSMSEVFVQQRLKQVIQEFKDGRREGSIVSTQTIESINMEDKETWRTIRKELEEIGISVAAFDANKGFIMSWFKEAIESGAFEEQMIHGNVDKRPEASYGSRFASTRSPNHKFAKLENQEVTGDEKPLNLNSVETQKATTPETLPNNPSQIDLDDIIDKLLKARDERQGTQIQLLETEVHYLCQTAREIFISQPMLLELKAPINVGGAIYGQYYDLLRLFELCGYPPKASYLFLGNYVDRRKQSMETICLLLAYKIKYPESFFLLRGKHECASMPEVYGFIDECATRYNRKTWRIFRDLFNCLPIAAIIDEKIFAMNGGLGPDINSMEQIRRILRPTEIPARGLLCDLLWSNPNKDITGWSGSDRGVSFTFGPDVVSRFLQKHDMDLICWTSQVVENGYEFFANRQLVTIFSAVDYDGFGNAGVIMTVDKSLLCSFKQLARIQKRGRKKNP